MKPTPPERPVLQAADRNPLEASPADRLLNGRVIVAQPVDGYRVAVDAVLLAAAVDALPGERVLDLGCGVGSVALCLAWRCPEARIFGLEQQLEFLAFARANAVANAMADRIHFEAGDVRDPPAMLRAVAFDRIVANPPYRKAGSGTVSTHPLKAAATVEGDAKLEDWVRCARDLLRPGGTFTLIHRADRLGELLTALADGFGDIAILPIVPKAARPAKRVILRAIRGATGKRSMLPEFCLHEEEGAFTAAAEAILRNGEALRVSDA